MEIPTESVKELQKIYLEEFGENIPYEDAEMRANQMINLFKTILKLKK